MDDSRDRKKSDGDNNNNDDAFEPDAPKCPAFLSLFFPTPILRDDESGPAPTLADNEQKDERGFVVRRADDGMYWFVPCEGFTHGVFIGFAVVCAACVMYVALLETMRLPQMAISRVHELVASTATQTNAIARAPDDSKYTIREV